MATDRIIGASQWEQDMYDHLREHGKVEAEILGEYRRLAEDAESSPAFRYLAGMILEDEIRHHRMFEDLAEAVRQLGELRAEDEPIPAVSGLRSDRDRIVDLTERLMEIESEDAKELKQLAKQLEDFRETTMWGLLVDLMRDDTEKHIKILRFIRDRAGDSYN